MAQRKAPTKRAAKADVPEGFEPLDNSKPEQLGFEPGDEVTGVLGPIFRSKDPEMPDYRTITIEGKRFYLPSHAGLLVLMEQPTGTKAFIRFNGGVGKKNDPFDYFVAVQKRSKAGNDEEAPF